MYQATRRKALVSFRMGIFRRRAQAGLESHESICVLNCSSEEALLKITIFFEDREPMEDILVVVPGRRTKHIRTSSLAKNGTSIPVGVPYAIEVHKRYSDHRAIQPAGRHASGECAHVRHGLSNKVK